MVEDTEQYLKFSDVSVSVVELHYHSALLR